MIESKISRYRPDGHWDRVLPCGHWVIIEDNQIIDGCIRCRSLEMRDSKDRIKNRREPN